MPRLHLRDPGMRQRLCTSARRGRIWKKLEQEEGGCREDVGLWILREKADEAVIVSCALRAGRV